MAERNTSEGFSKLRPVLGDLTNWVGKRDFSGSGLKSFSSNDIAKRICVSPSSCTEINSLKENVVSSIAKVHNENREPNVPDLGSDFSSIDVQSDCDNGKNALMSNSAVVGGNKDITILDASRGIVISKSFDELDNGNDVVDGCQEIGSFKVHNLASLNCKGPMSAELEGARALNSVATEAHGCSKLDLLKENKLLGIAKIVSEPKVVNPNCTVIGNVVDLTTNGDNEVNQEFGECFLAATSRTVSETGGYCLKEGKDFDCDESEASLGGGPSSINNNQNNEDDHNADYLGSQCGSVDCVILPESQESRVFERSTEGKKGDECDNVCGGTDSIKACTCSFCTKAAYIWSDLNYQDIKARVSAMKKSQKEASILAERSMRSKIIEKNGAENFTKVSKLESDLMYQWRFLFQHMADTWEEEGNQLEARLLPLVDLREKCNTDMESISTTLSENQ